jgi:Kef-type K+ transport system membrane component KefB
VALGAPLALGLFPRVRLPAIVLGIVIGPQVLGWVSIDTPIQVMSLLGLAFLLLLAGLEVEYERFRGHLSPYRRRVRNFVRTCAADRSRPT